MRRQRRLRDATQNNHATSIETNIVALTGRNSNTIYTGGVGLSTINLPTKIEISISIRYEDIKGDTKGGKWVVWCIVRGHSKSLEITPFYRAHTSSYCLA